MRYLAALALVALALPAAAQDAEFGRDLFNSFCVPCHGETGRGDGPLGDRLITPPADLTTLAAANGGVFPTAQVVRQIDGRDPELVHGGVMPLFGEYFDAQDTAIPSEAGQPILTSQPIADLVVYLKELQG